MYLNVQEWTITLYLQNVNSYEQSGSPNGKAMHCKTWDIRNIEQPDLAGSRSSTLNLPENYWNVLYTETV